MPKLPAEAYAIIEGRHSDPFHYLGLHPEGDRSVVRAFLPEASNVEAVGERGEVARLDRVHESGLFIGALPNGSRRYQLRAKFGGNVVEFEDAYRFPPILTDFDLYLLGEGTHQRLYDKLGAHPMILEGVEGIGDGDDPRRQRDLLPGEDREEVGDRHGVAPEQHAHGQGRFGLGRLDPDVGLDVFHAFFQ